MNTRRILGRVALVAGGIAFALLCAEGVARLGADVPANPSDPRILWDSWRFNPEFLIKYYNEQSVYDPPLGMITRALLKEEIEFQSRPGYRVVLLGDSITGDWPYFSKVQNVLRLYYPAVTFNFLNAGVAGWDTRQEYLYLRSRIERLKPNLVILQYCMNDFALTPVIWRARDGTIMAYNAGPWAEYLNSELLTHSVLAQKLLLGFLRRYPQGPGMDVEKVARGFAGIARMSREHGFELRIVLLPSFGAPPGFDEGQSLVVREIVERQGLQPQTVDLLDLPREYDTVKWQKSPGDFLHPNVEGSIVLGEKILGSLLKLKPQ